jgi:hypothetical protein
MRHCKLFLIATILSLVGCGGIHEAPSNANKTTPTATPSNTTSRPSSPNPTTPATTPENTMVKNLAIIEGVERDEVKVSRIRTLLAQLDERYPENQQQIGDMTAAAYNQIQKKGHSASIIGIMEAMMTASESKAKVSYADAVTAYIMLRVSGMR